MADNNKPKDSRDEFIQKCLGAEAVTVEVDGGVHASGRLSDNPGSVLSASGFEKEIKLIRDVIAEQAASGRDTVKVVNLVLNTPGGGVADANAIIEQIKAFKKDHPDILIIMHGNQVASAGLMIAAHCDEVYLRPEGEVGSIGIMATLPEVSDPEVVIASTDGKGQATDLAAHLGREDVQGKHAAFFSAVADHLTRKGAKVDLKAMQALRDEVVAAQVIAEKYAIEIVQAYSDSQKQGVLFVAPELPAELAGMPSIQKHLATIQQQSDWVGPDGKTLLQADTIKPSNLIRSLRLKAEKDIVLQRNADDVLWYCFLYSSDMMSAQDAARLGVVDGILDTAGYDKMLDERFHITPERVLVRTVKTNGVITAFPSAPEPVAANDDHQIEPPKNAAA
ncbi:MAG: S49 family peptidase [Alphaproteobacteria bacterium]|nr:S49 family peptidase [Alphaproteobacteria bacterium]MBV8548938.1 S49 family peptidase [Alphaproteobacteria bacterium]